MTLTSHTPNDFWSITASPHPTSHKVLDVGRIIDNFISAEQAERRRASKPVNLDEFERFRRQLNARYLTSIITDRAGTGKSVAVHLEERDRFRRKLHERYMPA